MLAQLLTLVLLFPPPLAGSAGQAAQAGSPAFEVVTIKRNLSGEGGSIGMQPGGRFRAVNTTLQFIISTMYRMPGGPRLFASQILGLPDWATTDRYDMVGKVADQFTGQSAQQQFRNMAPMVQAMLEDRFKLKVHRDTQPMPVFALVRDAKGGALGPKLRPTKTDCRAEPDKCRIESSPGHYSAVGMTMPNILIVLSNNAERVVIDHTGLTGSYDIDLDWATDAGSDKPSFFTAVQEQLGLKMEFRREPVDVVIVDHVERPAED